MKKHPVAPLSQPSLFDDLPPEVRLEEGNPCLPLYGYDPSGRTCRGCIHLRYRIQPNPNTRYWKCDLRRLTNGVSSDHHIGWPACAKYEPRVGAYTGG